MRLTVKELKTQTDRRLEQMTIEIERSKYEYGQLYELNGRLLKTLESFQNEMRTDMRDMRGILNQHGELLERIIEAVNGQGKLLEHHSKLLFTIVDDMYGERG